MHCQGSTAESAWVLLKNRFSWGKSDLSGAIVCVCLCAFNHSMTFVECVSEPQKCLPWQNIHFSSVFFHHSTEGMFYLYIVNGNANNLNMLTFLYKKHKKLNLKRAKKQKIEMFDWWLVEFVNFRSSTLQRIN